MLRTSRQLWILAGCCCLAAGAWAQEAVPFRTRNLSPLVSIFGVPAWHVPQASWEVDMTSELANHYRLSRRGPDQLILDGETWRNSLFVAKRLGPDWAVSLELPHYRIDGGVLDDVIDGWHSAFGLPDGGRNNRPEGDVSFELSRQNQVFYALDSSRSGVGDVQLGLSYTLDRDDSLFVTATVKLPTGDEDMLAGSGSTDVAVTLLRSRPVTFRNRAAGYYWGVGVLSLGDADRIQFEQESEGLIGVVGGAWQMLERFGLKAQLDMHTALFNSQLEEIGEDSYQATIGAWWSFSQRGVLEFGVNEDLEVSTSPDVVLHLDARWRW